MNFKNELLYIDPEPVLVLLSAYPAVPAFAVKAKISIKHNIRRQENPPFLI
jgi:hypothetical protein